MRVALRTRENCKISLIHAGTSEMPTKKKGHNKQLPENGSIRAPAGGVL
jgi:hypothetical protein